jgi:rfaE bifunctional protein nucleotidyltransferase chain/domain
MERIVEAERLSALGAEFAASGKKLVLTNGCFDLLHAGHIRYLEEARRLGDALIVAVNSDASVRELKGPDRPLNGELDRAEVLSALRCVDHVTVFTGKRVTAVIRALQPAIYAKGGDYTVETLDPGERSALEEAGTEIRLLSLVPGRSTTSLLERARKPSGS